MNETARPFPERVERSVVGTGFQDTVAGTAFALEPSLSQTRRRASCRSVSYWRSVCTLPYSLLTLVWIGVT